MPTIDVKGHLIDFPDNLSPDELNKAVGSAAEQLTDIGGDTTASPEGEKGLIRKGWDALAIPEKKSREGLRMLADFVPNPEPTGQEGFISKAVRAAIPLTDIIPQGTMGDLARGTPRIMADTFAEAAPPFVSRGSIVTTGVLGGAKMAAPLVKAAGRQIAKGAEAISGLEYKTPGILTQAANDSSLIFAPGTKKAGEKFAEIMDKSKIRPSFGRATNPGEIIQEAMKAADDGSLTPQEAVIARQTLDSIKKTVPRFAFNNMRDVFDSVAKTISKEADAAFSRGVKADALRNLFPQNKLGGTSIAKSALGSIAGVGPLVAMSPMAQGVVATLMGLARGPAGALISSPIGAGTTIGALAELARRKTNGN